MTDKYLNGSNVQRQLDNSILYSQLNPYSQQSNSLETSKILNSPPYKLEDKYDPFKVQVGGDHYTRFKIQPLQYIEENKIPFADGCIIKYVTRWRYKNGIEDLRKAKHFIEMLISMEERKNDSNTK